MQKNMTRQYALRHIGTANPLLFANSACDAMRVRSVAISYSGHPAKTRYARLVPGETGKPEPLRKQRENDCPRSMKVR